MIQSFQANEITDAVLAKLADSHTDITGAVHVQIDYSSTGKVLWINVNGICVLRICRIQELIVTGA